jgi:aminoglycoside phosphotransferase (APT) family kinase protein
VNILPLINNPAFIQEAELAIHEFCKEVGEITYIEHGSDNVVALVNKQYVFHFPRNGDAARRLAFEAALLQRIGKQIHSVRVPVIVKLQMRPLHVVSEYIEGDHLHLDFIQSLSADEQTAAGRSLGSFIVEMTQSVSGLEVQRLRREAGVDMTRESWDTYFERIFVATPLPNEKLRPVVTEYYGIWKEYVAHEQRTLTVHDDLHTNNLLFTGPQLTGVVDFSETNVGSIEEEMRWLYAMGDTVLEAAIAQYQTLTGTPVDKDHVRIWVIIQQLASFIKRFRAEETSSEHFLRAHRNLRAWIPNFPL